jgi:putative ABC transport system substrate-binding protein
MIKRRQFITALGSAAAWPVVAWAQQPAIPVIGFVDPGSADASAGWVAAFRKGLGETGYVEGQNVRVEYHWLEGEFDRLPALMADLVRRRVAVIATPGSTPCSIAAKAATATIPIVFGVSDDPVKLGLVASLARPGGNATGVNSFTAEVVAKRLALLRELVPEAVRVVLLHNPADSIGLLDAQEADRTIGLQTHILNASTSREIDAVFATLVRERADALFVLPDAFFTSRRVQITTLVARVGGVKPADLLVQQATKLELVINHKTARALGLTIPETLLATADEVIQRGGEISSRGSEARRRGPLARGRSRPKRCDVSGCSWGSGKTIRRQRAISPRSCGGLPHWVGLTAATCG